MRRLYFALCAVLLLTVRAKAQYIYSVKDLGTLGGTISSGSALNNADQVAGTAYLGGDAEHEADQVHEAFISGVNGAQPLRSLGTLGGTFSFGQGINSNGVVVGISQLPENPSGRTLQHAFVSGPNGGLLTDLGTLGGDNSYAFGVNGAGQVAGYSLIAGNGANRAFLSEANGGPLRDLGTLPDGTDSFVSNSGSSVNASGQVTGYSGTTSGYNHAFLSDPNGGALNDLGTLGGRYSFGVAVNDSGQVTGMSETGMLGSRHAFRSGPNGGQPLLDLSTLGGTSSFGEGINASGAVVGNSYLSGNAELHAFLYTTTHGMMDLNNLLTPGSGWVLQDAKAINTQGHITGVGTFGGQVHAFLLIPILPDAKISAISILSNGHVMLTGRGGASQNYGIEATGSLAEPFVRIANVTATGTGLIEFEDTETPLSRGFYRFVFP